jgi:hypothetical protein
VSIIGDGLVEGCLTGGSAGTGHSPILSVPFVQPEDCSTFVLAVKKIGCFVLVVDKALVRVPRASLHA